jgi:hypothetical protein
MRQHGAFRRAGGAGGIDQDADVVGRCLVDLAIESCVRVGLRKGIAVAEFAQRFERHQLLLAIVPQALHVDADDRLERGQRIIGHGVEHLVGLLLIAGHHDPSAAMPNDILQLNPRIGRIDADRDCADHLDTEVGVKPFRRILARDGDAVARLDSERHQAERDQARRRVIVVPGIALPDPVLLLAQREPLAMEPGPLAQQLRNGDRGVLQCIVQ